MSEPNWIDLAIFVSASIILAPKGSNDPGDRRLAVSQARSLWEEVRSYSPAGE